MGKAIEITEENFDDIIKSDKPTLIDFWAEWCGPCKMITPLIEELAGAYDGKAVIGKVNVDENQEVARRFNIVNIPTLLFLKNGEVVDRQIGAVPRSVLVEKLEKIL